MTKISLQDLYDNRSIIEVIRQIIEQKQNVLTAGENISIEGDVISATDEKAKWGKITGSLENQSDLVEVFEDFSEALDGKQDELNEENAGAGIVIRKDEETGIVKIYASASAYTGGNGIVIDTEKLTIEIDTAVTETVTGCENKIKEASASLEAEISKKADQSALETEISDRQSADSQLQTSIDAKQDELSSENAGTNITITKEGDVVKINATGGTDPIYTGGNGITVDAENHVIAIDEQVTETVAGATEKVSSEATARQSADATLQARIEEIATEILAKLTGTKATDIATATSDQYADCVTLREYLATIIAAGVRFKTSVETIDDLPTEGMQNGDMYAVQTAFDYGGKHYLAGSLVIYGTESGWVYLGATLDTSSFESINNKVTELGEGVTDTQYPSAKAVYDTCAELDDNIVSIEEELGSEEQAGTIQYKIKQNADNITAEATARAEAVTNEATARQSADATLQTNIDAKADQSTLTQEISDRQSADAALQTNIDAKSTVSASTEEGTGSTAKSITIDGTSWNLPSGSGGVTITRYTNYSDLHEAANNMVSGDILFIGSIGNGTQSAARIMTLKMGEYTYDYGLGSYYDGSTTYRVTTMVLQSSYVLISYLDTLTHTTDVQISASSITYADGMLYHFS